MPTLAQLATRGRQQDEIDWQAVEPHLRGLEADVRHATSVMKRFTRLIEYRVAVAQFRQKAARIADRYFGRYCQPTVHKSATPPGFQDEFIRRFRAGASHDELRRMVAAAGG